MRERQRWQPEEDALLREYVKHHGAKEWALVSERMGRPLHRDPKYCYKRWKNYLHPGLKKGSLSPDEQSLLISLQARYSNKWKAIAAHLPSRTPNRLDKWWEVFKEKQLKLASLSSFGPSVSPSPAASPSASTYEHILQTFAEKHTLLRDSSTGDDDGVVEEEDEAGGEEGDDEAAQEVCGEPSEGGEAGGGPGEEGGDGDDSGVAGEGDGAGELAGDLRASMMPKRTGSLFF